MSQKLPHIGSLWVEGSLSYLEQMCLLSFVANGHEVTLFNYGNIDNVPEGINQLDAREVHDPQKIIFNKQFGTPAPQSDIFRLHMIKNTGMIWADVDMFCVKPINYDSKHIFGFQDKSIVCNALLGLPSESPTLKNYLEYVSDEHPIPPWWDKGLRSDAEIKKNVGKWKHASEQPNGIYGPAALTWFLQHTGEINHAQKVKAFYPVPFRDAGDIGDIPARELRELYLDESTHAVHFWGRRIRWWVNNRGYIRHSFLDRKLRALGVDQGAAPIRANRKAGHLKLSNEEINKFAPVSLRNRYIRALQPSIRHAAEALEKIKTDNIYNTKQPSNPNHLRGVDYYKSDAEQVFAIARSIHRYWVNHNKAPNLVNPQSFTEKLLVMKMFAEIPTPSPADKLIAEEYVPEYCRDILTPVLRYWRSDKVELPTNAEIPAGNYWLKANFGQGKNRRIKFPLSDEDREVHLSSIRKWFEAPEHGFWAAEWWYAPIEKKIFLEMDLAPVDEDITDWKFWIVAGKMVFVQVDRDRSSNHVQMIYDERFRFINRQLYYQTSSILEKKPQRFEDMVRLAEGIGQQFEFARVDLYYQDGQIYLGEITLCPFGGKKKMRTPEIETELNELWKNTQLFH